MIAVYDSADVSLAKQGGGKYPKHGYQRIEAHTSAVSMKNTKDLQVPQGKFTYNGHRKFCQARCLFQGHISNKKNFIFFVPD